MNTLVFLYAVAYVLYLIWFVKKYGLSLSPGLILISFYTLIAVLAIPAYNMMPKDSFFYRYDFSNITLIPYIFLFVVTAIFLRPTFSWKMMLTHVPINYNERKVLLFSYIYILCAFISVFFYFRTIFDIYALGDMQQIADIRRNVYSGDQILAYSNLFERLFLSFTSYFRIPAMIIFFLILTSTKKKKSKIYFILYGLALILPSIGDAMRTVSRGLIISLAVELVLSFSFFSHWISRKIKIRVCTAMLVLLSLLYVYSMFVTEARFGEGDNAFSSLICYWGQPPIIFNSRIAELNDSLGGWYFFTQIFEFFNIQPSISMEVLGRHFIPCFMTFVGCLYIDFSFIGVVLIALVVPYLIYRFFKRKRMLRIGDLYLMLFYCLFLQHGALVTGTGYCYHIFVAFIIYHFMNYITLDSKSR